MYKQGSDPQDKARLCRVGCAVEGSDQHQEGLGGKRAFQYGVLIGLLSSPAQEDTNGP